MSPVRRWLARPVPAYAELFAQDRSAPHWAYDYARRLARRCPADRPVLIQTSMSPSGEFHVGNLRDTICAYLVHRALSRLGRRSLILLSFDDYDPLRDRQADRVPELRGFGGRPLAVAQSRVQRICRGYIEALKQLGICPPEADLDGRAPADSGWLTHYQSERYAAGEYASLQRRFQRRAGRIAGLLGVSDPRRMFSPYCRQCGRHGTAVLRLRAGAVRYRCHRCGAVDEVHELGRVKPAWALDWTLRVTHEGIDCEPAGQDHCSAGSTMDRTRVLFSRFVMRPQPVIVPYGLVRQDQHRGKVSGSAGDGRLPRELLEVMPPELILWLYAGPNCRSDLRISLDRPSYLSHYARFDWFVLRASRPGTRQRALFDLISRDTGPEELARLPSMRRVLAALHSRFYDPAAAAAALAEAAPGARPSLLGRVRYAHRWLARHGEATSWLHRPCDPGPPARYRQETLAGRWDRKRHRSLYATLFGVDSGPPLSRLREAFGDQPILTAVARFHDHGDRPLRELLLARLREGAADGD